jgi:hypothetical protein
VDTRTTAALEAGATAEFRFLFDYSRRKSWAKASAYDFCKYLLVAG